MKNQKTMLTMGLAVVALVAIGATAANYSPTPAYADKPQHCSSSAHNCFPSEKRSPGKSGSAQC